MDRFRRSLSDRTQDVLDWIDYRPDANFWPLFAVPPMLSIAWAYGGIIGLGVLLGAVLLLTVTLVLLAGVAVAGWIVLRATLDGLPMGFVTMPSRSSTVHGH